MKDRKEQPGNLQRDMKVRGKEKWVTIKQV